jgi:hypothetical protein
MFGGVALAGSDDGLVSLPGAPPLLLAGQLTESLQAVVLFDANRVEGPSSQGAARPGKRDCAEWNPDPYDKSCSTLTSRVRTRTASPSTSSSSSTRCSRRMNSLGPCCPLRPAGPTRRGRRVPGTPPSDRPPRHPDRTAQAEPVEHRQRVGPARQSGPDLG